MSDPRGTPDKWATRWRPAFLWLCVILVLTSWPSSGVSTEPGVQDKIGHFVIYAVLGLLVLRALVAPRHLVTLVLAFAAISIFGALDEIHQLWIPGRETSVWDWLADNLGALTGMIAGHLFLPLVRLRQDLAS